MHIFQSVGTIFRVEFQREPLKFHTKYRIHTIKDAIFIQHWNFKSSVRKDVILHSFEKHFYVFPIVQRLRRNLEMFSVYNGAGSRDKTLFLTDSNLAQP